MTAVHSVEKFSVGKHSVGKHSVEKIGGTSMSDYVAVRDNIILRRPAGDSLYQRIFVVSAYGGITNELLEHKKSGEPGVYGYFATELDDCPLRIKNTFEPEHSGTLITRGYVSDNPCVEIIAGCRGVYAIEVFDQDMIGAIDQYDQEILSVIGRCKGQIVSKDINANTITHYLSTNLKTVKRIRRALEEKFPEAEVDQQKVAIVSVIGSDMQIPGILAKTVSALAEQGINVLAMHQSKRQVDMQFMVSEDVYELAVKSLHRCLVEIHDHGSAICSA